MAVRWVWGAVALLVFFSLVASAELTETQAQVGNDLAALRAEVSRLYGQGNYAAALWIAERYVAAARQHHGEEHIEFASAITWLAYVYQAQGRYAEAEPLHQRALAIREKVFGADHPDVAQSLNNLANLYNVQGRYPEAEPLLKRALAIREKALGPGHSDVGISLNNLANLYNAQGRRPSRSTSAW